MKKHKFAHISVTVRDRAKRTIFGGHWSHIMSMLTTKNIFSTFQKFKKFKQIQKLLSSQTVGDRAKMIEIWDFFLTI